MWKVLQTILVLALLLAGGAFVGLSRNYALENCLLAASESVCSTSADMLGALVLLFVAYFGLKKLKELWPPKVRSQGE